MGFFSIMSCKRAKPGRFALLRYACSNELNPKFYDLGTIARLVWRVWGKEAFMAKLSFNISAPPPPKPMFPAWFRGALFIFIMTACSALITVAIYGR
jgi:hypothetical protein